ncbi:MAG: sterol desaturase family protein [Gammaproteobacteria bacterium]|nr:MAG: sterol desaturase family protein [Gammaproteobacteria bacterium]
MEHETAIRLGVFLGLLLAMGLWETVSPARPLQLPRLLRWTNNLGLVLLNGLLLRLLLPVAAVGVAAAAQRRGWGLFNVTDVPAWVALLGSVVILDLVIWLQHVMVHAIPVLWRLHRVHHADPDYDVTTGARFHPLEIFLSMGIKFTAILLLGAPPVAVVVFEVLLNGMALFNHGNVRLPRRVDQILRWLIVTPDMHRVHHSVEDDEANSNFGFNLSWWDRLFGTYRDQPRGGHGGMVIGIRKFRDPATVSWLPGLLMLPFRGGISGYAINRRRWEEEGDA